MDRTLGIFSASTLVLVLITGAMVSSSMGGQKDVTGPDGALLVAKGFITSEATFKFDGMMDTLDLNVTGTYPQPEKYEVTGDFTSAHGGFGDRQSKVVTQALTPHNCIIIVDGKQVASAVMDGSFDMVSQKLINSTK
jgi:hypothetical protein